jgi:hypothetical protein
MRRPHGTSIRNAVKSGQRQGMANFNEFLRTKPGTILLVLAVLLGGLFAGYTVWKTMFKDDFSDARYTWYIDETGKTFKHVNKVGEMGPVLSPNTGKEAFPAEACYWTRDGGVKKDPTWVLLNSYLGNDAPTFCPDCGRLVVGHNPPARPGARPPKTKEEYEQNGGN